MAARIIPDKARQYKYKKMSYYLIKKVAWESCEKLGNIFITMDEKELWEKQNNK